MTIKERLQGLIESSCTSAVFQGRAPGDLTVTIEKPRAKERGDFASGIALSVSGGNVGASMLIAQSIVDNLKAVPKDVLTAKVETPGFINFRLGPLWLCQSLCDLHTLSEGFAPTQTDGKIDRGQTASKNDPLFYIQYTHAKLSAYMRLALEPQIDTDTGRLAEPIISEFAELMRAYQSLPLVFKPFFSDDEALFIRQKAIVLHLDDYQTLGDLAADDAGKKCITDYAYQLACHLESLFAQCRLITDGTDVTISVLGLILAAKRVLAHTLGRVGLSAPEAI